ncbi:PP2C family protein-serine/threonine phosphatase [Candidatus Thiodictyon syntrophicum]|jgi:protein phosphatase|uniref:Serine/threonine protein phosphatase n=1 Tax=Candidatus Thiodictyon syntrophicum TaxID=1166950 RepID=A0A2K8U8Z7_9GAMM|nr:protein phosphatase 2C domain-containing protein [Candidatus Thiodictyon syntrophicum]AUB82027.1 serine/threonine protein phosphatase [Candidatus Thiodictyon syntrophicum]
MWAYKLEYAWRTDRGRVRTRNEDAVTVHADMGLVVVADGVGGASAGEVASRLAADTIRERFKRQALPRTDADKARLLTEAAVEEANRAVWQLSQTKTDCVGMGTTVVLGFAGADWLAYANVGDSRLYRLRGERLEQLSHDHSFIQEVVDQGFFRTLEDARHYGIGDNILTRALGSSAEVRVYSGVSDLQTGDIYLFCTDGLTGMVPVDWLRQILVAAGKSELGPAAEALVRLANERGGTDNITLALLRVGERPAEDAPDGPVPVGAP